MKPLFIGARSAMKTLLVNAAKTAMIVCRKKSIKWGPFFVLDTDHRGDFTDDLVDDVGCGFTDVLGVPRTPIHGSDLIG